MKRHIGKILAGVALSSALAACATPPGVHRRTAQAVTQGVVIGTVTFDGKTEALRYVYVPVRPVANPDGDAIPNAPATRVVLTSRPLDGDALAAIAADHWNGDARIRGAVVDIASDSRWEAKFLSMAGFDGTYGITSSGGTATVTDGRVRGRIALSNQNERGIRELKVSFNAGVTSAERTTRESAALIGRWHIADWTQSNNGHRHTGDFDIERNEDGVVAQARIHTDGADYIAEEAFDVRFDGDAVHLFGVVDPEARWTADAMTLRFDGRKGELAGDAVDDGGAGGILRLVRSR